MLTTIKTNTIQIIDDTRHAKTNSLLCFIFLIPFLTSSVIAGWNDPVNFGCVNLEMAVEDELGILDPTEEDMLWLTSITHKECTNAGNLSDANDCNEAITDLSGLEYAHNLQYIDFYLNKITSISPLENLTKLKDVSLGRNYILDLGPLRDLTRLRYLDVHGNGLSDLSPLSGLNKLRTLRVGWNNISDVSPLSGLSNLTELDIYNNGLSDISPLSGLTSLDTLYMEDNEISDISALSGLINLSHIGAQNNQISDISALAGLSNLSILHLDENQISDILPLTDLTSLTRLHLRYNPLGQEACYIYPQIIANNPGIYFEHDPCLDDRWGSPLVSTYEAKNVRETSARLEAYLEDYGEEVCDGWFRYWIKGHQAQTEQSTSKHYSLHASERYGKEVHNLTPSTTYNFQAMAENSHGLAAGNIREFTTLENVIHVDDDAVSDPAPYDLLISDPQEDGTTSHPYDSIQEAIDRAQDLGTIVVHEGRYYETLNLMGKRLEIGGSTAGTSELSAYPVIDAQNKGTVVTFNHGETPECVLSRVVLTGGLHDTSGAIACLGASPTIRHCLIVGNDSTDPAGAIIHVEDSQSLFENVTVYGNVGDGGGSAFRFTDSEALITNSILWNNELNEITVASGNNPIVIYSDVQGTWPGPGNIDADPLFASPSDRTDPGDPSFVFLSEDYHLLSETGHWNPNSLTWQADELTSPCIDAGNPYDSVLDETVPNGKRINMGVYGGTAQASLSPILALAHWRFDETSGNRASDSLGYRDGTVYGATWIDGILDGALGFDGENDYVDCGNSPDLVPDAMTMSLWVYPDVLEGFLVHKSGTGAYDKDYELSLNAGGIKAAIGGFDQFTNLRSNTKVYADEWSHVAFSYGEGVLSVYINGVLDASKTYDFALTDKRHALSIGCGNTTNKFMGKIDNVRIYDMVLSEEKVLALFKEVQ